MSVLIQLLYCSSLIFSFAHADSDLKNLISKTETKLKSEKKLEDRVKILGLFQKDLRAMEHPYYKKGAPKVPPGLFETSAALTSLFDGDFTDKQACTDEGLRAQILSDFLAPEKPLPQEGKVALKLLALVCGKSRLSRY